MWQFAMKTFVVVSVSVVVSVAVVVSVVVAACHFPVAITYCNK